MKRLGLLATFNCAIAGSLNASTDLISPKLVGIISLPDRKCVLLEIKYSHPPNSTDRLILSEEQRAGQVEVLHITPANGNAELRIGSTNRLLTLPGNSDTKTTGTPNIAFENAELSFVLELYGYFAGRTLLQHPSLQTQNFSLRAEATNRTRAAMVLESLLATKDVLALPHEEKFTLIVPKALAESARPHPVGKQWRVSGKDEMLAAGFVNWRNATSTQVIQVYADLVGRKLDLEAARNVRSFPVSFQNQTPLTKSEIVHALDVLLEWWDIKLVAEGNDLLKPVINSSK